MNLDAAGALDYGDVPTWIGAVGTLVAFLIAAAVAVWQVRHQRSLAAVERTIALHRDLTAGEIGLSRDRLSEYMWRFGAKRGIGTCWQPT